MIDLIVIRAECFCGWVGPWDYRDNRRTVNREAFLHRVHNMTTHEREDVRVVEAYID